MEMKLYDFSQLAIFQLLTKLNWNILINEDEVDNFFETDHRKFSDLNLQ